MAELVANLNFGGETGPTAEGSAELFHLLRLVRARMDG